MGRFSHEAAAVDPETGIVCLTEDATPSGLYRFVPDVPENNIVLTGERGFFGDFTGSEWCGPPSNRRTATGCS